MDLTKMYDAYLKPDWNLEKTEFNGPRITIDWGKGKNNKHSYYKEEKITVASLLPSNARWLFHAQTN